MYLNREHHRYEPLDEHDGEQVQDGDDNPRHRIDENENAAGGNTDENTETVPKGAIGSQARAGAEAAESSDDEDDREVRPKEGNGASNEAYNGNSSSDEDDKGGDQRSVRFTAEVHSSCGEDDDDITRPKRELVNRGLGDSSDDNQNTDNDDDDEPLSLETPQQRHDDSSSQSSHGTNPRDDEMLLQA